MVAVRSSPCTVLFERSLAAAGGDLCRDSFRIEPARYDVIGEDIGKRRFVLRLHERIDRTRRKFTERFVRRREYRERARAVERIDEPGGFHGRDERRVVGGIECVGDDGLVRVHRMTDDHRILHAAHGIAHSVSREGGDRKTHGTERGCRRGVDAHDRCAQIDDRSSQRARRAVHGAVGLNRKASDAGCALGASLQARETGIGGKEPVAEGRDYARCHNRACSRLPGTGARRFLVRCGSGGCLDGT